MGPVAANITARRGCVMPAGPEALCALPPRAPTRKGARPARPFLPPGKSGDTVSDTETGTSS